MLMYDVLMYDVCSLPIAHCSLLCLATTYINILILKYQPMPFEASIGIFYGRGGKFK